MPQMEKRIFHPIAGAAFGLSLMAFTPTAQANDLRVCKASAAINPVTGTFHFEGTGGSVFSVDVAVGTCAIFGATPNVPIVVTETAVAGTILTSVTAVDIGTGMSIPVTADLVARTATFTLAPFGPDTVTFTSLGTGLTGVTEPV